MSSGDGNVARREDVDQAESLESGAKSSGGGVPQQCRVESSVRLAATSSAPEATTTMVPVVIAEPRGLIEIDLGGGRRVGVDADALARNARFSEQLMIAFQGGVRVAWRQLTPHIPAGQRPCPT